MKDRTGTRVGSYEIVERLGGGGMAAVYRAVQQPLGREVALKALSPELFQDDGFVKRFEAEAKTLAKLDHPNILPIYDFELTEGMAYLTMPLIRGGTLRDVLNRGALDTLSAWRYLRVIRDRFQAAHAHREHFLAADGRAAAVAGGGGRAGRGGYRTRRADSSSQPTAGRAGCDEAHSRAAANRAWLSAAEHGLTERLVRHPDIADD